VTGLLVLLPGLRLDELRSDQTAEVPTGSAAIDALREATVRAARRFTGSWHYRRVRPGPQPCRHKADYGASLDLRRLLPQCAQRRLRLPGENRHQRDRGRIHCGTVLLPVLQRGERYVNRLCKFTL
jgi:hypothetical protein